MIFSDSSQASWRKATVRGCGFVFAAFVALWSMAAVAQVFTLTLLPTGLTSGTRNSPYSQQITAVGGNGNYTYNLKPGDSLPPGMTFSPTGLLSGTPTSANSYTFTLEAVDTGGGSGNRPYTFSVGTPNSITINPGSLPDGTINVAYNQSLTAINGSGGYVFSGGAGLPPGLSLSSGGVVSGTPTAGGSFTFTANVTDSNGNTGTRSISLNIIVPIIVNPANLPNGTTGTPYSQTITASGGSSPYTFDVSAGSLPNGLALNPGTGAITGTPSAAGNFNFTIRATDAGSSTGTRAYSVTINAAPLTINPASLPPGQVGTGYNQSVTASGGIGPYDYVVLSGSLPTGLALNPNTGAITGNPSAGGTFNFTIQATDSSANTGSRAYTVNIGTNSLVIAPATLPNGTRNVAYSQGVSASGGTGPYTYVVSAGALPAGLTLNASSGAITGTPTGSGLSTFTIRATDTLNNFGAQAYNVNIGTNSLTINPATLPAAITGRPYSATVVAVGGTGPYIYSVSSGTLPPGLTLNPSSGVISGTMTGNGPFTFTISALDSLGNTGSRAYTLINRPDPALDPEVIGLVNAQVAAARRFASAQIDNLSRHLERLHNFNPCSMDIGVGLPQPGDNKSRLYPETTPYSPSPGNAARSYDTNSPAGQVARRTPGSQECGTDGWTSRLAAWALGSVQFGSVMPDGSVAGGRFTTAGLTAGIDWRVHNDLIVGVAVGYGNDRSTIGSFGTSSNSSSVSGALYASYSAFDPWFIDAAIGYGQLGYDNRRFVSDDNVTVAGNRKGSYWFGTATAGYEFKYHAIQVSPYVRADFMQAQLNSYAEQGSSAELLTFAAMKFHSVGGTVGLRGSYDMQMGWGVLTPNARVEFRQTLDGAFQQSMNYSDIGPSLTSTLVQAGAARGTVNASLGLRARSHGGMSGELEYGTSADGGKVQSQTIRAGLKVPF
jgi:uncharacterized protein YhjY with autotransporter beta-barrel domain